MHYRRWVAVALPALVALAVLQPRGAPSLDPQPTAEQIDAALRIAQSDAGLPARSQSAHR